MDPLLNAFIALIFVALIAISATVLSFLDHVKVSLFKMSVDYFRKSLEEMIQSFEHQIKLIEEDAELDGKDAYYRIDKVDGKIGAIKEALVIFNIYFPPKKSNEDKKLPYASRRGGES